jgi:hypothetical protein
MIGSRIRQMLIQCRFSLKQGILLEIFLKLQIIHNISFSKRRIALTQKCQ